MSNRPDHTGHDRTAAATAPGPGAAAVPEAAAVTAGGRARRHPVLRTVVTGVVLVGLLATAGRLLEAPERPQLTGAPVVPPSTSTPDPSLPAPLVDMSVSRSSEDAGRTVNITLDDGPDPRWTPKILDVLARNQVKAVFCMIGPNAKAHPDLVKQVVAAGHRLCDHSVSHDTAMDHKSVDYQQKEILDAKEMIDQASGGEPVHYYRAPGGAFTLESRQIAAAHGMRPLGWNVDTRDWERPGSDKILESAKVQVRRGPTVLMHDGGGNRAQTLEALEEFLPWLKANGYTFSFPEH
ncbi:polysaccharide deacetylase family protein [Kitasatospora sp. HPMI-4]|uniref:polysaccharide deacetylase family protein n=1 Tax=Kitasatospora sp. HPMI-4 TaxID=3448443 RepID=UPI003F1DB5E7